MTKRKWLFGVAVLALIGVAVFARGFWTADKGDAHAQGLRAQAARPVPVEIGKAERKQVPVRLDALGTVTPIASVALKARVDTNITGVHFADGAHVTKGEKLFTLDCRVTEALITVTEGNLARDRAQLAGAQRDVQRYTDLVAKSATPTVNLDNAKTQADVFTAAIKSDQGTLDNLKAQRSYCDVTAPITGVISAANVKVGNFVRQADTQPMATIIQMAPVYVSFTVPQKNLTALRSGADPGPDQARPRSGLDDREHRRLDDGHGDVARDDAEHRRTFVAGHAGDRGDDLAQRGGGGGAIARRPGQPDGQLCLRRCR